MDTQNIVATSSAVANAVQVVANGAALLTQMHNAMLEEVSTLVQNCQKLEAELEEQRRRADEAERKLAEAEAALKRMNHEPRKEETDHA